MKTDTVKAVLLLAGVGYVGWKVYQANRAVDRATAFVVDQATTTFNPASKENFIFESTQSLGKVIGKGLFNIFN